MSESYTSVSFIEIENRARALRAEAARDGLVAIRGAIANAVSALFARRAKTA